MADRLTATLSWHSGLRFEALSGSGHRLIVDSPGRPGHTGPSPMELMLIGVAGCTAIDVVGILEKMRQPLAGLDVDVTSERSPSNPKSFTSISIAYRVRGSGLDLEKVERAVELSHSTYCSALASLRPDCKVISSIELSQG